MARKRQLYVTVLPFGSNISGKPAGRPMSNVTFKAGSPVAFVGHVGRPILPVSASKCAEPRTKEFKTLTVERPQMACGPTEFPIPSCMRFRHVLFWAFPCPAWAVASSCSSSPQARRNSLKLSRKISMNDGMGNSVERGLPKGFSLFSALPLAGCVVG